MQLEALIGLQRHRKRLSVYDPAQHLKTRVPIFYFASGQAGWVRRTTFAQQAKMVGRQRLQCS